MLFYHYHHSSDEAKKMLYDLYYEKGMANEWNNVRNSLFNNEE